MDTTDTNISFDKNGVCNHCLDRDFRTEQFPKNAEEAQSRLQKMAEEIIHYGKNRTYDSLIGLSGGLDSSYLLYLAKQVNLKPLVVHFDNGWNSELAVKNIENLVKTLDLDLQTFVIDWEEFRDLQRSFLKASVVDIEILTDQAIISSMFKLARENEIKYILYGNNFATETHLPQSWTWVKLDAKNIKSIQKLYGTMKIRSFPLMGVMKYTLMQVLMGYRFIPLLNLIQYNKDQAIKILKRECGWKEYGGKHSESIFTTFYQNYILPRKFYIDKRKSHLSSLICSEHISREEALEEIKQPPYSSLELEHDKDYIIKKLGFSPKEFDEIMATPPRSHLEYPSEYYIYKSLSFIKKSILRKVKLGNLISNATTKKI